MSKRPLSLLLIVTLFNLILASCRADDTRRQSVRQESVVVPDAQQTTIDDAGELHNQIVDRFIKNSGLDFGELIDRDTFTRVFVVSINEVFRENDVKAEIRKSDIDEIFVEFDTVRSKGLYDFYSRDRADVRPLLQHLVNQGKLTRAEADGVEQTFTGLEQVGFTPSNWEVFHKTVEDVRKSNKHGEFASTVDNALDIADDSFRYWTTRFCDRPLGIDSGRNGMTLVDFRTIAIIGVDALAAILMAWAGPTVSIAAGALASIAFIVLTSD